MTYIFELTSTDWTNKHSYISYDIEFVNYLFLHLVFSMKRCPLHMCFDFCFFFCVSRHFCVWKSVCLYTYVSSLCFSLAFFFYLFFFPFLVCLFLFYLNSLFYYYIFQCLLYSYERGKWMWIWVGGEVGGEDLEAFGGGET